MSKRRIGCLLIFCILYETEKTGIIDHSGHIYHDGAAVYKHSDPDSSQLFEADAGVYDR